MDKYHREKDSRAVRRLARYKRVNGRSYIARNKEFYSSFEWSVCRYNILKASEGKCSLCGRGRKEGAVLVVDHIKPIRWHWHLRLDPENLQVLCFDCNKGKGNTDETDWR